MSERLLETAAHQWLNVGPTTATLAQLLANAEATCLPGQSLFKYEIYYTCVVYILLSWEVNNTNIILREWRIMCA